jgi:hypothetical protein
MSPKNKTPSTDTDSGLVSSAKLASHLLMRHYETWSRLCVEQRVGMFESDE